MKTKYLFIAAIGVVTLASCADDVFVGDNSPNVVEEEATNTEGMINFGFEFPNRTRADIGGNAAADLLGNHFYVTGTKGTEQATYPTPTLVFDNYLVRYTENTAGTTESNTANWEYVGVVPGTAPDANYVKLGSYLTGDNHSGQTIKYWDYSQAQYDFFAFSTGKGMKAVAFDGVNQSSPAADEIGVTAMKYGVNLNVSPTVPVAYKFFIPSVAAIEKTFITDITEVAQANYGNEVTLKFKNLGSKVRVALYETIPGYSVKDVEFYTVDGEDDLSGAKGDDAALISANTNGLPTRGTIEVYFKHVGTTYQTGSANAATDYNKASIQVTPITTSSEKYKTFGELDNFASADRDENNSAKIYLGRTLPNATFAGEPDDSYYKTVFPVDLANSSPLTLRVNYTLVSIDGSEEEINVYGAKAVVPSTYTVWQPNYAYTYIFKISDNTNGWTDPNASYPAGLFPITFDAVVAEATDANAEQTTVTTVATPSITTYQQGHNPYTNGTFAPADEYSKAGAKLYVQVMDNKQVPASLVTNLSNTNSLLFAVSNAAGTNTPISEATVMDALENRSSETTSSGVTTITGRNGIVLTSNANINNAVTEIENGVDDNPIGVQAGEAAEITIASLTAGTKYAYVYDYTPAANTPKTKTTVYQPITVTTAKLPTGTTYVTKATLDGIDTETSGNVTTEGEAVDKNYLYFSKTNKTTVSGSNPVEYTYTYSFVSVDGKKTLPAGLVKCSVSLLSTTTDGSVDTSTAAFAFTTYIRNNGNYAVKVIKVVA